MPVSHQVSPNQHQFNSCDSSFGSYSLLKTSYQAFRLGGRPFYQRSHFALSSFANRQYVEECLSTLVKNYHLLMILHRLCSHVNLFHCHLMLH